MSLIPRTIFAVFDNPKNADAAVGELTKIGYGANEISVIAKEEAAVTGAALAGLVGLLVGVGAITIPELGAILVAGPIATATTVAAAATGAVTGGVVGALIKVGLPKETATYYEERIKQGGALLAVPLKNNDQENTVRTILENANAQNLHIIT